MGSKMALEKKAQVVSEIVDKINNANSVILFDYLGLTAEEVTELRNILRDSNSGYKVFKNTLTKRAMDELNLNVDEFLTGPSAMAFSEDIIAPAKVLSEFSKKHDALKIKVGIVDGEISGLDVISKLASIPSREGLLTMLAGGMIQYIKDLSVSLNLLAEQMGDEVESPAAEVKEEVKEEVVTEAVEETVNQNNEKENKEEK